MFPLPDSVELVVAVLLGILTFVVSRWLSKRWRQRRALKDQAARRASESRQVRRARERKQR
jgi:hypothetical protein